MFHGKFYIITEALNPVRKHLQEVMIDADSLQVLS